MLRCLLIATLTACQGLSSLAGATLCLHSDGGFCLERESDGHCQQHDGPAAADPCCCGSVDQPANHARNTIGITPCDCTHLAIADHPQMSAKPDENGNSKPLSWGAIAINLIFTEPGAAMSSSHATPVVIAGAGPSAALSFLAPVMLRC